MPLLPNAQGHLFPRSTCAALGLCAIFFAAKSPNALAGGLGEELVAPRAIGRAGTAVVSLDSGPGLIINPGAQVRRTSPRLYVSTSVTARGVTFRGKDNPDSPPSVNLSGPSLSPSLAYHFGSDEGAWVVGIAYLNGDHRVSFPMPTPGQKPEDIERLFPHRYAGSRASLTWRRTAVGAAVRIGDSIGLGASISLAQLSLEEQRTLWAGFSGRDRLLDPTYDVQLRVRGHDFLVPGASVGALIAPISLPLEFGLAAELSRGARLHAKTVEVTASTPQVLTTSPTARSDFPDSLTLRTGARYLGERIFAEVEASLFVLGGGKTEPTWDVTGVTIVDQTGRMAKLEEAPSLLHGRTHVTGRGAIDVEVLPGYMWLTTGYSWSAPGSPASWRKPSFAQQGGHTGALGLEVMQNGFTLSAGYARTFRRTRTISPSLKEAPVLNPFDAGTAVSNAGDYTTSQDRIGFAIEYAWN